MADDKQISKHKTEQESARRKRRKRRERELNKNFQMKFHLKPETAKMYKTLPR